MPRTESERFWAKVMPSADGCLLWQAGTSHGYGMFRRSPDLGGKLVGAHRWAWESTHGPILEDLTVDHLCKQTRCVNVAHLELVTRRVNSQRRGSDVCGKGHRRPSGTSCKDCVREAMRRLRARRKAGTNMLESGAAA